MCAQSCLTLCNPMDCSPPGIFQARILEWVVISSSRGSSQPRDWIQVSRIFCVGRWILYHLSHDDESNCSPSGFQFPSSFPTFSPIVISTQMHCWGVGGELKSSVFFFISLQYSSNLPSATEKIIPSKISIYLHSPKSVNTCYMTKGN